MELKEHLRMLDGALEIPSEHELDLATIAFQGYIDCAKKYGEYDYLCEETTLFFIAVDPADPVLVAALRAMIGHILTECPAADLQLRKFAGDIEPALVPLVFP